MAGTIQDLRLAKQQFMRLMRIAMTAAIDTSADEVLEEMKALTSLTDHSLQELRKMGHPYSVNQPEGTPHDDFMTHIQSGDLHKGLKRGRGRNNRNEIVAEILSEADYTWAVLLGNGRMRPRDFVSAALINKEGEVGRIIQSAHKQVHDYYEGTRFRPYRILLVHKGPVQLPPDKR